MSSEADVNFSLVLLRPFASADAEHPVTLCTADLWHHGEVQCSEAAQPHLEASLARELQHLC